MPFSTGGKKGRQTYTRYQTTVLESQYKTNKYATKAQRRQLTEVIGLRDRQIKIWFQNRRMKDKKDQKKQEEERQLSDSRTKSTTEHSFSSVAPQQVELQATNSVIPLKQDLTVKVGNHRTHSPLKHQYSTSNPVTADPLGASLNVNSYYPCQPFYR